MLETALKNLTRLTTLGMALAVFHPCGVRAQNAGSFVTTVGAEWLNFANSSAQPIVSSSAFGTFTSPGTDAAVHNAFTPTLLLTYFITDHVAVEGFVAVPPKLEVSGQGDVTAFGAGGPSLALSSFQPALTARAFAPIVVAKYYFDAAESKLRPFLGAGVNYTWFRSVQLNPLFSGALSRVAGPGGTAQASASPSWNPVLTAGGTYQINKRWSFTGSVAWFPLKTTASFNAIDANGQVVLANKTRLSVAPLLVNLGVGYRF